MFFWSLTLQIIARSHAFCLHLNSVPLKCPSLEAPIIILIPNFQRWKYRNILSKFVLIFNKYFIRVISFSLKIIFRPVNNLMRRYLLLLMLCYSIIINLQHNASMKMIHPLKIKVALVRFKAENFFVLCFCILFSLSFIFKYFLSCYRTNLSKCLLPKIKIISAWAFCIEFSFKIILLLCFCFTRPKAIKLPCFC